MIFIKTYIISEAFQDLSNMSSRKKLLENMDKTRLIFKARNDFDDVDLSIRLCDILNKNNIDYDSAKKSAGKYYVNVHGDVVDKARLAIENSGFFDSWVVESETRKNYQESTVISSIKPNGGDKKNYWMFYVGPGYPSQKEIKQFGKDNGCTTIWWGSDEAPAYKFKGTYNGDTLIVCKDVEKLPVGYKEDAKKYGKLIEAFKKDNQRRKKPNSMNKVAEDFEECNLTKMGTNEYEANENRDKHIKMYRKFANLNDDEIITEENINDWALQKTATTCNRHPDRIKSEILGRRYSAYEV